MKKIIFTMIVSLILFTGFTTPIYALSDAQSMAIQTLLDDACRISDVPGMSISIIDKGETFYFSSGYADREKRLPASENTLYELASVSKAFTGVGILLLEEQGLLSMTDPVQKYLPWLTMTYNGLPVDMQNLTLNHFLHHTSGLTNRKHIKIIPQGSTPDMLQKTVGALVGTELAFPPGEQYVYGTINYDILGLIIEVVSGQSYERFMTEQVFKPLGLDHTYVYKEAAQATGQLAQGYRSSFFITSPYDAPDYAGNKPAGYIMSCTKDMAHWMNIQMGNVSDIPEVLKVAIMKSHHGDVSVPGVNNMHYAAGWMVNDDKTIIEHSGNNPNFSTEVAILPSERTALCLLTNGTNTNIGLVKNIKDILDGNLTQSYKISSIQLLDILVSFATIIISLLAIILFILGLRQNKIHVRQSITKNRILITVVWLMVIAVMCIMCWGFPMFFGLHWSTLLVWQTYSILTVLISLVLLTVSIAFFASTHHHNDAP